ncbi:adenosine deaminase/editase [Podospora didyma]|uniref:Adenosine deaminase/editase n=1 Tax=Podospora didyma TaxID=330526 RepID=A0AAE0P6B5_9PEZI|nr:adenosine deaminase/editase [Podospora didyma]
MTHEADAIASVVLEEFNRLSSKRKPCVRDNGVHEWVPLSGIVAKGPGSMKCVALATGMKCLPASKLSQANGVALHDWHAEVLALRAFNCFILQECRRLADGKSSSPSSSKFLRRRTDAELEDSKIHDNKDWNSKPFTWREDVTLHMYCSEAPCGDASMELIMAAQDDASPWESPTPATTTTSDYPSPEEEPSLLGRGFFSQLGIVRRKPSRGDAPPSLSKSCSDKIALKQATSPLSSLTSLLVSPKNLYLTTLILPESQYSLEGCQRCFSPSSSEGGRMAPLANQTWRDSDYAFTPFSIETTGIEFYFSKRAVGARIEGTTTGVKMGASNLAVAWTGDKLVEEGLIGGVLQGRKHFDQKGASAVSRWRMWKLAAEVASLLSVDEGRDAASEISQVLLADKTYDEVKESGLLATRRAVKEEARRDALKGWVRNKGDGSFRLSS